MNWNFLFVRSEEMMMSRGFRCMSSLYKKEKINMNLNFTDFMSHALIGIMPLLPIHLLQSKSIIVYSEENWSQ